jgi:hypothetical protein
MDTLNVLMLLGQYERFRNDPGLNGAIGLLLTHWRKRTEPWRPYGFGIGSDFQKLKYPAVKYGILRVLDVLSLYPAAVTLPNTGRCLSPFWKITTEIFMPNRRPAPTRSSISGRPKHPAGGLTFLVSRLQKRTSDILSL